MSIAFVGLLVDCSGEYEPWVGRDELGLGSAFNHDEPHLIDLAGALVDAGGGSRSVGVHGVRPNLGVSGLKAVEAPVRTFRGVSAAVGIDPAEGGNVTNFSARAMDAARGGRGRIVGRYDEVVKQAAKASRLDWASV